MTFNFGSKPTGAFGSTGSGFNFGSSTTGASSSGFNFGSKPAGAATSSTGGFSFGSTATTSASTGFNFGSKLGTSTSSSGFGFGSGTGFGGFNSTAKTTSSLFGGTFGTVTTTTPSGLNFGGLSTTGTGLSTGFGNQLQQQQQQQQQGQVNPDLLLLASALSVPTIYGDERDNILKKWNQLQAFWGTGKGYINQNNSVNFTPENPFCRFKTVGYSIKPTSKNSDGLIILQLNKKEAEVQNNQQQLVDTLFRVLGSKPTLSVCVEDVKTVPNNKCEVTIYILERSPNGMTKRVSASQAYQFMNHPSCQSQLSTLGVVGLVPRVQLSTSQLQEYLKNPPFGYDPRLWRQAQLDNPDPDNLIPLPLVGFETLKSRLEQQAQFTKQHQARLEHIGKESQQLDQDKNTLLARLSEYRRKHQDLSHRLLQVFVKQEIQRKRGVALQMDEEQLWTRLEALFAEVNAPTQVKGRLNEMLSHIRQQSQVCFGRAEERYELTMDMQQEIKLHLKQQQEGISHLVEVIKDDLEDLKLIEQDMSEVIATRR